MPIKVVGKKINAITTIKDVDGFGHDLGVMISFTDGTILTIKATIDEEANDVPCIEWHLDNLPFNEREDI